MRLNGRLYEVIGVFEKDPGLFGGFGVDQFACIPLSNFHKNYPEIRDVFLLFTVREDANWTRCATAWWMPCAGAGACRTIGGERFRSRRPEFLHRPLEPAYRRDGAADRRHQLDRSAGGRNRRDEYHADFGHRADRARSASARRSARANRISGSQFLLEAVTLSGIGGVLGIMTGGAISVAARALAGIPATLSLFWVVLGVAISVGVGLFFGYYPANRAANLDPIVCLRYE